MLKMAETTPSNMFLDDKLGGRGNECKIEFKELLETSAKLADWHRSASQSE